MACGSCSKRNNSRSALTVYDLTGGVNISSLNAQQVRARLEVFKRKFCRDCSNRYDCDYSRYLICKSTK